MPTEKREIFIFDDVRVDALTFKLWKAGIPVAVEPKALRVLLFLLHNRGRLVEKEEILDSVWKETSVTENSLTREIGKLRRLLGDDPKQARYIQTVHTRGYRFVAEVEVLNGDAKEVFEPDVDAAELARAHAVASANGSQNGAATPAATPHTGTTAPSPDGKLLAFQSKRGDDMQIMLIPSDGGTPTQLTFDRGDKWPYSWSPGGDKIVFAGARRGIWNLWWISPSDKSERQLTHNTKPGVILRFPGWSPLGDQIIYEQAEITGNIYVMFLKN